MTEFLYVQTRRFHKDYDTPQDHERFRWQWNHAGRLALADAPRNVVDVANEVGLMHRAWNGPWCIPTRDDTTDGRTFVIDEANSLYRCCVCGTAWRVSSVEELKEASRAQLSP